MMALIATSLIANCEKIRAPTSAENPDRQSAASNTSPTASHNGIAGNLVEKKVTKKVAGPAVWGLGPRWQNLCMGRFVMGGTELSSQSGADFRRVAK